MTQRRYNIGTWEATRVHFEVEKRANMELPSVKDLFEKESMADYEKEYHTILPISNIFCYKPTLANYEEYKQAVILRKTHTIKIESDTTETQIRSLQFPIFAIRQIRGPKLFQLNCYYNRGGMLLGKFKTDKDNYIIISDWNPIVLELCKNNTDKWLEFMKVSIAPLINFDKLQYVVMKHASIKDRTSQIVLETLGINLWNRSSLNLISNIIMNV